MASEIPIAKSFTFYNYVRYLLSHSDEKTPLKFTTVFLGFPKLELVISSWYIDHELASDTRLL